LVHKSRISEESLKNSEFIELNLDLVSSDFYLFRNLKASMDIVFLSYYKLKQAVTTWLEEEDKTFVSKVILLLTINGIII